MTATYEAVGASSANTNGCTPAPPAGTGTGFVATIVWGNASDTPPDPPADWTLRGHVAGGAGAWGMDSGLRHISVFWSDAAISGNQSFLFPSGADAESMCIGYIVRFAKTETYWVPPEVAGGSDNVGGAGFSAVLDRDPGATTNDAYLLTFAANTDAVNPGGITLTWPGTTQGTGTTAVATSPFGTGNDSRVTIRRGVITGTSSGAPTAASTTDFTGAVSLARIRDSSVAPTEMDAGPDQSGVEPGATVTLDSSASVNVPAGRTWSQTSGTTVSLSSTTATSPTFVAPPTVGGDTLVFRVTDDTSAVYDEVSISILPASRVVVIGGVKVPVYRRLTT